MKATHLILLLFILSACGTKDDPELPLNPSSFIFFTSGTLNNQSFQMAVGKNNAFMNTRYIHNNVLYKFKGTLGENGCTDCKNSLSIMFNDSSFTTNGNPSTITKVIYSGSKPYFARPNMGPNLSLGKLYIDYVDANGTKFSSEHFPQPVFNQFTINSAEPYLANSQGQKTMKLNVSFDCRVYSAGNDSLDFRNMNGIIAIAYP